MMGDKGDRSQFCKVRCASNHLIVSVYLVTQVQGVGRADDLSYFKCPTTKQMRFHVNAYRQSGDAVSNTDHNSSTLCQ
jgi:hypothetical protein